jgi:chorismate synthase
VTAALVAVGAICRKALEARGIQIGTHILSCHGIRDRAFHTLSEDIALLNESTFPTLSPEAGQKMRAEILTHKEHGDSVGGILETAVIGMPAGVGEPWFDTLEGVLSHALFSIPAIKGVEFGDGFALADMLGSEAQDPFRMVDGSVITATNHNGGINGGISNGMPLLYRVAVKPTPTLSIPLDTVDLSTGENVTLAARGRHDPAIIHRARVVVDAVSAIVLADQIAVHYGTDFLSQKA